MRDSMTALRGAIEKFKRGDEGDFRQALIIADHATEAIMRNYLIFKENITPPHDYPSLLNVVCEKTNIPVDVIETIGIFRFIRDGFHHHDIGKIEKGLKGTTIGLTLEKSYLEDYLKAVCRLLTQITGNQISMGGE